MDTNRELLVALHEAAEAILRAATALRDFWVTADEICNPPTA